MPAIRFGGMASGLPPNIVDQLIEAERIPIKSQEANKAKADSKLKLVTELETKISDVSKTIGELVGTKGFQNNKFTSGDPNIIAGTVDPETAVTGSWNIEVMQLAQKPSAITNGFPDKDTTEIGVGYLKFETPDGTKEVYVNGGSTTLEGVAKSINASGVGVRATIVNDRSDKSNPYRLVISGLSTGDDKQVTFPTVYMLDGDSDFYFDQSRPAQNGKIKVDGFEMEVSENTIKDIIPGVTIDLKQAAPGRDILVSIKEDYEVISGKVDEFVKAMNGVFQFIQAQNSLNEKTDTSKTLGGDSLLRTIENRMRNMVQAPQFGAGGTIQRLSQIGIQFERNGTLKFEKTKFDSMLARQPKEIQAFLTGDGFNTGFVPTLKREIGNLMNQAYGPLSNRKRGLQQKIDTINKQIDNKERQLARKEESLRRQFSRLEETMSKLQSQGAAVGAIGAGPKPPG